MKKQFVGDDISFRKLIENSYSGITLFDKEFNIIYRSPSVEQVNGWSDTERMKSTFENLVHPLDRNNVDATFKKVLASPGKPYTVRFRSKHFQGYYIWLECVFTNMFAIPGIKAIVCNSIDISDKVQADDLLQQSIKELSAYKYALDESSIVAVADENGIIRHVNNNFCKVSHFSKEEAIGQNHSNFNYSLQNEATKTKILETIGTGKIWRGELKKRTKDDGNYWVDTTIVPFLNQKGRPYRYVTIQNDITERRKSEARVVRNEAFIRTLTDNLSVMIAYWTANRRCLFSNKAYSDWFGKNHNEMRGLSQENLMGHDGKSFRHFEKYITAVLNGEPQSFENVTKKPDGSTVYLHMHYLPDKEHDKVRGYYSFVYDITECKIAELEVRKKNEQIENILESITDGFITLDNNMCCTYANKQIGSILNTKPAALTGKKIWDLFPDIVGSKTYDAIHKVYQDKEYIINEDYYAPLKLWQENHIYPTENGVSIFIRDITKHKEEEIAKNQLAATLTESLKERNTILESITDAFFAVDKNWVVTYWNNSAEKVLHKTKKQILNKNLWEVFSQSDNSDSYNYYQQALATGESVHFEDYYAPLNSWFDISAYPSANGLSVYFKVITERKKATLELKESEKRFSDLFQLSPLPMWVFDLESLRFLDVNLAAIQHYGYTKEEFLALTIKDIRPESELPELAKALGQAKNSENIDFRGIFTHRKKNGELIQVDIQSNAIRYKGRAAKVVLANDVTERLNYIETIEKQNENLLEISWLQSHVIRAPLARIMGLVPLLKKPSVDDTENQQMLDYILISSNELDEVIRNITDKTVNSAYKLEKKMAR